MSTSTDPIPEWTHQYRAALRDFMQRRARPVQINRDAEYDFEEVSNYGWADDEAWTHVATPEPCSWVVPEGATLTERTYSMFEDTFTGNRNEVGVNAYPCHCACGAFTDVTLRFTGSLGEVTSEVLRIDRATPITL